MEQASAWTKAFDGGKFVRKSSEFRDELSLEGVFNFESGRYHLYISHACPWAHRTLITRNLLGLHNHISYDVVDWRMSNDGSWNSTQKSQVPLKIQSMKAIVLRTSTRLLMKDGKIVGK